MLCSNRKEACTLNKKYAVNSKVHLITRVYGIYTYNYVCTYLVPGVRPSAWLRENDDELGARQEREGSNWRQWMSEVSGALFKEDGKGGGEGGGGGGGGGRGGGGEGGGGRGGGRGGEGGGGGIDRRGRSKRCRG